MVCVSTTFQTSLESSANRKIFKRRGIEGVVGPTAKVKSYLWKPLLSTLMGAEYIKSPVLTAQHSKKKNLMLLHEG